MGLCKGGRERRGPTVELDDKIWVVGRVFLDVQVHSIQDSRAKGAAGRRAAQVHIPDLISRPASDTLRILIASHRVHLKFACCVRVLWC